MAREKETAPVVKPMPPLPWPSEWEGNLEGSRRRSIKLFVGFAILAFLAVVATTPDLFVVFAAPALIVLNFAITSFLASQLDLRRTIDRAQSQTSVNGQRIFVPVHRWYKGLYHITNIAVGAFGLAWIYIGSLGEYDGPRMFLTYLAAFTAAPALVIWSLARLSSRIAFRLRGPRMGLAISEDGISQISWWGETRFAWDSISDISAVKVVTARFIGKGKVPRYLFQVRLGVTEKGREYARRRFSRLHPASLPIVAGRASVIDVAELDVYPPVVPHLLTFYFEHPELRGELATEKAIERVRTGNFVA